MPLLSMNPATGETLRTLATLDDEALQTRIAITFDAAAKQRLLPLEHRVLCLRKLASLLEEDASELARLITRETGKPIRHALAEVQNCIDSCRYYADNAVKFLSPELLPGDGGQAFVQWSPMGIVLAVMSWASPLWNAFRFAIPALVAGNAVLLKQAGSVSQCTLQVEALVRRAGFPRGALTALQIEDRTVEAVLADDRVAAVTVHDVESTGRALAAKAGWQLKKSTLHLPASDPMIVMPSADLGDVITAVTGAFAHEAGIRRIILHTELYNDAVNRLIAAVETLRVGDPIREDVEVGPLGTVDSLTLLQEQVKAAVAAGGRVLAGGSRMVGQGNFFEPTLLSDVPRSAAVATDIVYGPVCLVFRARDLKEALAIANDPPTGRSASVWTNDPAEQPLLISGVDAGSVALNSLPAQSPRLPVGGVKRSGYGRDLGLQGIREFLVAKTVSLSK